MISFSLENEDFGIHRKMTSKNLLKKSEELIENDKITILTEEKENLLRELQEIKEKNALLEENMIKKETISEEELKKITKENLELKNEIQLAFFEKDKAMSQYKEENEIIAKEKEEIIEKNEELIKELELNKDNLVKEIEKKEILNNEKSEIINKSMEEIKILKEGLIFIY